MYSMYMRLCQLLSMRCAVPLACISRLPSTPSDGLCRYLIPGGSAGHFKREGYTFDVGSSMMFGFGDEGTTNLITKCLKAVGKRMETVPDPTKVVYHLPKSSRFPEVRR